MGATAVAGATTTGATGAGVGGGVGGRVGGRVGLFTPPGHASMHFEKM